MAVSFSWDDAEEIGFQLCEKFPERNPLEVRFTDLHRYFQVRRSAHSNDDAVVRCHCESLGRDAQLVSPGLQNRKDVLAELIRCNRLCETCRWLRDGQRSAGHSTTGSVHNGPG